MISSRRRTLFKLVFISLSVTVSYYICINTSLSELPAITATYRQLRHYWYSLTGQAGQLSRDNPRIRKAMQTCKRKLVAESMIKPLAKMRKFDARSPIRIYTTEGRETIDLPCAVKCLHQPKVFFADDAGNWKKEKPDATFQRLNEAERAQYEVLTIFRTMESASNYPASSFESARTHYDIVMTTNLRTHVPVPYYSWVMHNFMKPVEPKNHDAPYLTSAFISNCAATSFRLDAIRKFQQLFPNLGIDYRGRCSTRQVLNGSHVAAGVRLNDDKPSVMRQYKFHFAFENSQEEDYVTEKYYECLIEGTVPVVIGAPNIYDFEPSNNTVLLLNSVDDVQKVGERMMQLAKDEGAYDEMLAWKKTGLSDKFKAVVDLAVVHSSCRLCIHVADVIHQRQECRLYSDTVNCIDEVRRIFDDRLLVELLTKEPANSTTVAPKTTTVTTTKSQTITAAKRIKLKSTTRKHTASTPIVKNKETQMCSCYVDTDDDLDEKFHLHLLRVRERGLFSFKAVFLDSRSMTVKALHREILHTFGSLWPPYKPVWTAERDDRGVQSLNKPRYVNETVELRIYRVYPVGASQRAALYGDASLDTNRKLANFVKRRPCGRVEVIFV